MIGKMEIQVKGVEEVANALIRMGSSITPEMVATMEDAANETEDILKQNFQSRSGSLAESIDHELRVEGTTVSAHIGPNDSNFDGRRVGAGTEAGKPAGGGFPNWHEIADRYGVLPGVGFAIAKKIHEQGSTGLFYAQKTVEIVRGMFYERGLEAVRRITSR